MGTHGDAHGGRWLDHRMRGSAQQADHNYDTVVTGWRNAESRGVTSRTVLPTANAPLAPMVASSPACTVLSSSRTAVPGSASLLTERSAAAYLTYSSMYDLFSSDVSNRQFITHTLGRASVRDFQRMFVSEQHRSKR